MATSVPEFLKQRASQSRPSPSQPTPSRGGEGPARPSSIPESLYKRASERSVDTPLSKTYEKKTGGYSERMAGSREGFKKTVAPALSEAAAGIVGLPGDVINLIGGFEGGPVGEKIKEYVTSEGIKRHITEPIRERLAGPLDEDSMETQLSRRYGRLAGPATLLTGPLGLISAGIGAGAGQFLQEQGYGPTAQAVGEAAGMGLPSLAKSATTFARLPKGTPGKLRMPRAVDAKMPKVGAVSAARQQKTLKSLDEEAASIARGILEEKHPIIKDIEAGVDFGAQFEKEFGDVERLAKKYNTQIGVTPLSDFVSKEGSRLAGVPRLSPESASIKSEIQAFRRKPPTSLHSLLKTYRQNNEKISGIYDTALMSGKQKKYLNFLEGYNKAIISSIKSTLPKDSSWVKLFEDANKKFGAYKNAQKAERLLEPILGEDQSIGRFVKYGSDPRLKKKLITSFGEKGAAQISDLATDLKKAQTAVKNIPVKEWQWWDSLFPLHYLLPEGTHFLAYPHVAAKLVKVGRRGYGRFLTSPKRAQLFSDLVKAFNAGDKKAYAAAAKPLLESVFSEEETDEW